MEFSRVFYKDISLDEDNIFSGKILQKITRLNRLALKKNKIICY